MALTTVARPVANKNCEMVRRNLFRKKGKSGQDLNGLSPAQQFCGYHSITGSAGLHKVQHKVQNALLGGSLECTIVKALGVKQPTGYGGI